MQARHASACLCKRPTRDARACLAQGVRRPALPDRLRQKYRFAVHEVGRALVSTVLRSRELAAGRKPRLERVERVSMVPRGQCAPV